MWLLLSMNKGKFSPEEQLLQTMQGNLLQEVLCHSFGSGSSHNINQGYLSAQRKLQPRTVLHKGHACFCFLNLCIVYLHRLLERKILCVLPINNKASTGLFLLKKQWILLS